MKMNTEAVVLNSVLRELIQPTIFMDPSGKVHETLPGAITEAEASTLYQLALESPSGDTLETGLGFGVSALAILQAQSEVASGHHITIDPHQQAHVAGAGILNIKRAGFANLHEHYEEFSHTALAFLSNSKVQLKLAFIDGCHRFENVFMDFILIDPLLKVGGFIAFHDSQAPAVQKVIAYLLCWRADDYRPVSPHVVPANGLLYFYQLARLFWVHPLEPALVLTLARWEMKTLTVFQKTSPRSLKDLGETEDFYKAF